MSGVPGRLNLTVVRGNSFLLEIFFTGVNELPMDVTGRTWAAQWRPTFASEAHVDFEVDVTEIAEGLVKLRLDDTVTPTMTDGVWDLRETYSGDTSTLLQGEVVVIATATR